MTMDKINDILRKVEISSASHQKQLKILKEHYEKVSPEIFFSDMCKVLKNIFYTNSLPYKNPYVERALNFFAQFVADVTPEDTIIEELMNVDLHPFLTMIVKETLKYHNSVNENLRYNSCMFVRLILLYIGSNTNLDNEVCDIIEEAMLERTLDPKALIRLQGIQSLIRLQDPRNPDSPVNRTYLSLFADLNPQIRAEVVKHIAPYSSSIPQIVNRLRDIDSIVRIAAFRRCADLGPRHFKIIERQQILTCGLAENNIKVKNVFIENLLPKWLNAYGKNYISFLNGIKLDGDENDIYNTGKITRDVLNLLLRSTPVEEISSILSLNENKVISINELKSEAVAVWNILVLYLRENENMDDYLDDIIPDLTPFCNYIESIAKEKEAITMKEWEYLDYQYILTYLFEIAESYDFSDEVGRKTLHQLLLKLLRQGNLLTQLIEKLVALAAKTAQKNDDFTSIICHIISEIQEPLIEMEVEVNHSEEMNKECQKAELKVKIIRLEADLEDATDNQEYLKAEELKNEVNQLRSKLQELLVTKPPTEMVKVTKDDIKTVSECLDILISMLILPSVDTMTPSLVAVKDEFVIPLLKRDTSEINWRVLKCIALFCILDRDVAEEYLKVISVPIITYKTIANFNRQSMIISVKTIPDLFRLYGENLFGNMENVITNGSTSQSLNSTNSNKRKLYRTEDSDEAIVIINKFHLESIIDVMLDMLDDEISEIRNVAIEAISKLILNGFPASPLLISRLVLKWYNPLTAQTSDKSHQLIGAVLSNYAKYSEGASEVIGKAIIPTLNSIVSAPRTSPLAEVDIENVLLFFSTITESDNKMIVSKTHINMAHLFTYEIIKKKNGAIAIYLSKLLLYLDISTENVVAIKELKTQIVSALEEEHLSDRVLRRNLLKFKMKLTSNLETINSSTNNNLTITDKSKITINAERNVNETNNSIFNTETNQTTHGNNGQLKHITVINDENNETENNDTASNSSNKETVDDSEKKRSRKRNSDDKNISDSNLSDNELPQQRLKRLKICLNRIKNTETKNNNITCKNKESTTEDSNIISETSEDVETYVVLDLKRKRSGEMVRDGDVLSETSSETNADRQNAKKRKKQIECKNASNATEHANSNNKGISNTKTELKVILNKLIVHKNNRVNPFKAKYLGESNTKTGLKVILNKLIVHKNRFTAKENITKDEEIRSRFNKNRKEVRKGKHTLRNVYVSSSSSEEIVAFKNTKNRNKETSNGQTAKELITDNNTLKPTSDVINSRQLNQDKQNENKNLTLKKSKERGTNYTSSENSTDRNTRSTRNRMLSKQDDSSSELSDTRNGRSKNNVTKCISRKKETIKNNCESSFELKNDNLLQIREKRNAKKKVLLDLTGNRNRSLWRISENDISTETVLHTIVNSSSEVMEMLNDSSFSPQSSVNSPLKRSEISNENSPIKQNKIDASKLEKGKRFTRSAMRTDN